jgi:hypothetical protein
MYDSFGLSWLYAGPNGPHLGDGSQMPGNKCSNCSAYNFECKYEEAAKVRSLITTSLLSTNPDPPC